jgi:hypothetical protein
MPTEVVQDPYGESLIQLGRYGAPVRHAGDFLVAVTHDVPDSFYETDHAGLTWREPAPFTPSGSVCWWPTRSTAGSYPV